MGIQVLQRHMRFRGIFSPSQCNVKMCYNSSPLTLSGHVCVSWRGNTKLPQDPQRSPESQKRTKAIVLTAVPQGTARDQHRAEENHRHANLPPCSVLTLPGRDGTEQWEAGPLGSTLRLCTSDKPKPPNLKIRRKRNHVNRNIFL